MKSKKQKTPVKNRRLDGYVVLAHLSLPWPIHYDTKAESGYCSHSPLATTTYMLVVALARYWPSYLTGSRQSAGYIG